MSASIDEEIALVEEVRYAIYLIESGLIVLNRIENFGRIVLNRAENVEHLPILLLSSGFERLLKTMFLLDHLERYGQFPNERNFEKKHDVNFWLKQALNISKEWKYAEKCVSARADMDYLENDCDLRRLVKILADYGQRYRYYNIDLIIGKKQTSSDPIHVFESYREEISNRMRNSQENAISGTPEERNSDRYAYANRQITKSLQRFARALCRMFIWGKLGQIGDNLRNVVGYFLDLQDADLEQVQFSWFGS
jgi:hypothetical protein